jgi:hypothetical protein
MGFIYTYFTYSFIQKDPPRIHLSPLKGELPKSKKQKKQKKQKNKKTKKTKKTKKPKNKKKHQKKTKKPNKNVEGVGEEAKSRSECLTEPERSQKEKLLTKIWNEQ